ncbi:MAG: 1,5-anhydro-D-fructose reductase [Nitrosomonadaceae bacterium]|nr:1,5-anhydro-D-fructose reductase [Nitrosomonadaceae bacterium]
MIKMVQIGIDHPHAEAYRGSLWALRDRIQIVGFLRRESDNVSRIADEFKDVPVFHSLDALLTDTRPDAAQVMLRNNEMGGVLSKLATEGIHLWAEKPEARRAADLDQVRKIINDKGLVFTAGYQSRFYATTRYVHSLVREGILGPLTFANMSTATSTVKLRNPLGPHGYIFDERISGGGIFHWLGCHMIDLLLSIVAETPTEVTAFTGTVGESQIAVEDVASAVLRFPSGWIASLNYGYLIPTKEASPFTDDEPEPGLYGQQGWVRWNNASHETKAFSIDPRWNTSPWQHHCYSAPTGVGYGHAAHLAMINFIDAIAGVVEPMYRIEEAITVLKVIEAAYESSRTGRSVRIN